MELTKHSGRLSSKLGGYSAGVSRKRSTKPWDLILPDDLFSLGLKFQSAAYEYKRKQLEVLLLRGRCHLLLNQIADQGLLETYDTLKDIREFYSSQRVDETYLPTEEWTSVEVTGSYQRPEFPLPED